MTGFSASGESEPRYPHERAGVAVSSNAVIERGVSWIRGIREVPLSPHGVRLAMSNRPSDNARFDGPWGIRKVPLSPAPSSLNEIAPAAGAASGHCLVAAHRQMLMAARDVFSSLVDHRRWCAVVEPSSAVRSRRNRSVCLSVGSCSMRSTTPGICRIRACV